MPRYWICAVCEKRDFELNAPSIQCSKKSCKKWTHELCANVILADYEHRDFTCSKCLSKAKVRANNKAKNISTSTPRCTRASLSLTPEHVSQQSEPSASDSLHLVLSPSGQSQQRSQSPVVQPAAEVALLAQSPPVLPPPGPPPPLLLTPPPPNPPAPLLPGASRGGGRGGQGARLPKVCQFQNDYRPWPKNAFWARPKIEFGACVKE